MATTNEVNMEELFGENEQIENPPLVKESPQKKGAKPKKPPSNISLINTTSFLETIREESKSTRETVQNAHDYIREALISLKKEIVNDVIQELNPRLNEIEELLKEVKTEITAKNGEPESESDSNESEDDQEENRNEVNNQPAGNNRGEAPIRGRARVNRGGEGIRGNNNFRARESRGGRGSGRDARVFYLMRQLGKEGFGRANARDRWSPYQDYSRNGGSSRRH